MVTPLYVFYSSKILSDIFALTLMMVSIYFFWLGFEKNSGKSKLLCGFFTGLAFLARYTSLILIPLYAIDLILTRKNLRFLKDKFTILSFVIFLATLVPWFMYGYSAYGNPLGPFLHAQQASTIWGGAQPWYFFFENALAITSVLGLLSLVGLYFLVRNLDKAGFLILLWFFIFFIFTSALPHKEDRYFLSVVPAMAMMSAVGMGKAFGRIKSKHWKSAIIVIVALTLAIVSANRLYSEYSMSHTDEISCFLNANTFLSGVEDNAVIITDSSATVYYYTKRENHFYTPEYAQLENLINEHYKNRPIYVLWSEYDLPSKKFQTELQEDSDFTPVYRCPADGSLAIVYSYKGTGSV
jgi:4-amino-4-deoxy-L-arabinose transferase-like glycosyltransferase